MAHKGDRLTARGYGEYAYDAFVIFDERIDEGIGTDYSEWTRKQASLFMHELGHNLIGCHYPENKYVHNPEAEHLIDTDEEPGREHCPHKDCAMYVPKWYEPWKPRVDYCNDCWAVMRLDRCLENAEHYK